MSRKVPRKEAELVAFIEVIIGGLKADPEIFENPPLTSQQLSDFVSNVNLSIDNVAQNKSSYEAAIMAKDINVKTLYKSAVEIVNYCYRITKDNKSLLAKVGLTPPSEKKPAEIPGQCRVFRIEKHQINGAVFKWKHPVSGGRIRAYIIQRKESEASADSWENVWTVTEKKAEIKDQPEGKTFDYRVRALNPSGIGIPSNIVTVKF